MKRLIALLAFVCLAIESWAGTVSGKLQTANSGAVAQATISFTLNMPAVISGTAAIVPSTVSCYTDNGGNIVGLQDPPALPALSTNTISGTLASGTYFVKVTWANATGETATSSESSVFLPSTGTVIVNVPVVVPSNATQLKIYIGTSSGAETLQSTQGGPPFSNYSQSTPLVAGSALPSSNTSTCSLRFTDELIPSTTYYTVSVTNANGNRMAGYPQQSVRFYGGSAATANVSAGWPTSTAGVVLPTPIVASPNANATQSINGGLNLNGFSLTAGAVTAQSVNGFQYPTAFTCTAIQNAIYAAPSGGTVLLPAGNYSCPFVSGSQLINITKSITIRGTNIGAGAGVGAVIQPDGTCNASTDVIAINPTAAIEGLVLADFEIMPTAGNPCRYGINFNTPTFGVSKVTIERVRVGTTGSTTGNYALQNTNTSNATPLFLATIMDSVFYGGVNLDNVGDSILFIRNNVTGPRDLRINSVTGHVDGGAHGIQIIANNLTPTGGTNIVNAPQGVFAYNDIEQPVATTNANNCMVCVLGVNTNHILGFQIVGNYLGATTGNVADTIRVDFADGTIIRDGVNVRGSTGATYRITANATDTQILNNRQIPFGEAITTFLSDSGTRTQVDWMDSTVGQRLITPFVVTSTANAQIFAAIGGQARVQGSTGVIGFTSSSSAVAGIDTGISRLAANAFGFGNGNFGDVTGQIRAATHSFPETTAPSAGAGFDQCYGDSTAHALECSYNNGSFFPMVQRIGSGTVTTAGTAVTNGTCQAQTGITVTGATTTDVASCSLNAALPATWQTGIFLSVPVVTSNTVTVSLCNPTAGSITPAAATVRCTVTR